MTPQTFWQPDGVPYWQRAGYVAPVSEVKVTPLDTAFMQVDAYLKAHIGGATFKQLREAINKTDVSIRVALCKLKHQGLVTSVWHKENKGRVIYKYDHEGALQ